MSKKAVTTAYSLSLSGLKRPLRLALVSDIHERKQDDVLRLLKKEAPDLIAVAGDTFERYDFDDSLPCQPSRVSALQHIFLVVAHRINYLFMITFGRRDRPEPENAYAFLREAARCAPVFLSLGNHEMQLSQEDLSFLRENGITLLDNADVCVEIGENTLRVGGLSEYEDEDWLRSFSRKDGFKLLLCHCPEYYDEMVRGLDVDLTLSGHNHGGQFRFFGRGVLSSSGRLFPKYDKGVFEDRLVVSAGCANTVALPRLRNPRELVMLELLPAEKPKNE